MQGVQFHRLPRGFHSVDSLSRLMFHYGQRKQLLSIFWYRCAIFPRLIEGQHLSSNPLVPTQLPFQVSPPFASREWQTILSRMLRFYLQERVC